MPSTLLPGGSCATSAYDSKLSDNCAKLNLPWSRKDPNRGKFNLERAIVFSYANTGTTAVVFYIESSLHADLGTIDS